MPPPLRLSGVYWCDVDIPLGFKFAELDDRTHEDLYDIDLIRYRDPQFPTDPAPNNRNLDNWDEEEMEETQRVTHGAVEGWEEEYQDN